jgi:predicted AAA+ superfamily ATPase
MDDRYFSRFLGKALKADAVRPLSRGAKPKVNLVLGARQTGKSTLLEHCVRKGRRTFVLNLQDRRERRRYEADPGVLVRELEAAPEIDTVFIDEVQKVPSLLDDVQYLYDREPRKRRFFLSGSSARKLKRGSANLLPGRVRTRLVSPVLQAEQRKTELLPLPMTGRPRFPPRSLEDCLVYGSLPGRYHEQPAEWRETLAAYVDLYIENEIRQENVVEDMGAFARFLRLAALESGQCVNFTKLAGAVGVAVNTLRNFYQVLEDTYVGIRVHPFGRSRRRILRAPRFLLFDLGVRHVLAELPLGDALLKLDAGHVFEQWVLTELYYRCRCLGPGYKLSTWQTATGAEVDAVVETPDAALPVEVKWTDRPSPRDARHVETFLDHHGDMAGHGYVVCRCPRRQKLTDRVSALPWDRF